MNLKEANNDERAREKARVWRTAIYLCKDGPEEMEVLDNIPSIDQQRAICRRKAATWPVEIIGEFVDGQFIGPRPGLQQVFELADNAKLDLVIVASLDRLTCDVEEAFDIALRLLATGTFILPVFSDNEFRWTRASKARS